MANHINNKKTKNKGKKENVNKEKKRALRQHLEKR